MCNPKLTFDNGQSAPQEVEMVVAHKCMTVRGSENHEEAEEFEQSDDEDGSSESEGGESEFEGFPEDEMPV